LRQIAILGPTASGKTSLSINLAEELNANILSLDSLSIYKEIDIASAKPTLEERNGIKHFGIDVLHVKGREVSLYEVKSSTGLKDIYLHDVSIQYYVLAHLGFSVKDAYVVHVNNSYVRGDELDLHELFCVVDVSEEVRALQSDIPMHLSEFKACLDDKEREPNIDIGKHCKSPYECDAKEYCWKVQRNIPDYSVFNIFNLGSKKQIELYEQGIVDIKDVPEDFAMSPNQSSAVQNYKSGETHIHVKAIKEFCESLSYPLYHLDFETYQQAVPLYKGISPYQQIPFQYSLHVKDLNNLYMFTNRAMKGELQVDGNYAYVEKKIQLDGASDFLDAKTTFTLDDNVLHVNSDDLSIVKITDMLYYPKVFDSFSTLEADYNLTSEVGVVSINALNGKLMKSELTDLVQAVSGFDLSTEIYKDSLFRGVVNKNKVDFSLLMNGLESYFKIPDGYVDLGTNKIKSDFDIKIKNKDLQGSIKGSLEKPIVELSGSEYIKQKLDKAIDKNVPEEWKDTAKGLLKLFG